MICPNCGVNLPDTAKMCYICKTVFQNESQTGGLSGPIPQYQNNYQPNIIHPQMQMYPINTQNIRGAEGVRLGAMITGLLGSILCGVSLFMPYFTASFLGASSSVTLYEDFSFDGKIFALAILLAMLASLYSVKVGMGILLDLTGLALIVINLVEAYMNLNRMEEKSEFSSLISKGVGFYTMLLGAAVIILAGILAGVAKSKESRYRYYF